MLASEAREPCRNKFTLLFQCVWTQLCLPQGPDPSPVLLTSSLTRAVLGQGSSGWALHPVQLMSCFLHEYMYLYVWKELYCYVSARFQTVKLIRCWYCQGSIHVSWNSGWQWISASHPFKITLDVLFSDGAGWLALLSCQFAHICFSKHQTLAAMDMKVWSSRERMRC